MRATVTGKVLTWLGVVTGAAYVAIDLLGGLQASHWEDASTSDRVVWTALLIGGGILVLAGLWLFARAPWVGALLVSLGAVAGALPIFWTIVVLAVALALVVSSVLTARRMTAPA